MLGVCGAAPTTMRPEDDYARPPALANLDPVKDGLNAEVIICRYTAGGTDD
jgi:hypothetical protein